MRQTVVLNVVGLARDLVGPSTPNLAKLSQAKLGTILPAVTCSVQSTMLTGLSPRDHGIVGNGWYHRDLAEVLFWRQSNALVSGEKVWDAARKKDPAFSVAKMFWWFNMYSSANFAVTPRPMYPADGRKIADIYTEPADLRERLNADLGAFPLFHFWGPRADILSSRWIAESAKHVFDAHAPTLSLVYLPHLDYDLQRLGPDDPKIQVALREIDQVCGDLIDHVTRAGARVLVVSEYAITAARRVVHLNRVLRDAGLLRVRDELGLEKLDAGGSLAFAVADHQIAHVYVKDRNRIAEVKKLLESVSGVEQVLDDEGKRARGLDHARSGELVAIAAEDAWFSYYYWYDDSLAPDFARTVDIHRKPGYDPVELFVDPKLRIPALKIGARLAQKTLGFRYLMDVIPLDASLVKGTHGRPSTDPGKQPVLMSSAPDLLPREAACGDVKQIILDHVFR